jgi:organic hydroperoxide reductase OsmC/OhrA
MNVRPKLRHYAITVEGDGTPKQEEGGALTWSLLWTPEHLLLAALARCTVLALDYHARRESLDVAATAAASGVVGPRDDGSWGFLEIDCEIDATLSPQPPVDRFQALAARAQRGCFVGQSLTATPRYRWTINGEALV